MGDINVYIGIGLIWGIVMNSGPWAWILHKLDLEDSFLDCALCTGFHVAWIVSALRMEFNPLGYALVPLMAELLTRWIRK